MEGTLTRKQAPKKATEQAHGPCARRQRIERNNRYLAALDDLRKTIERGIEMEAISIQQLAERSGLATSTINRFLGIGGRITLDPGFFTVHELLIAVHASFTAALPPKKKTKTSKSGRRK